MVCLKHIQWSGIGKKMIETKEVLETRVNKRKCDRKYTYADKESFKKLQCSGRIRLENFERATRYYFEHSDMKLGYMQKRAIDVYTILSLRKFFKNDLISNLHYLSNKFLIDQLNNAGAILFPRMIHTFI